MRHKSVFAMITFGNWFVDLSTLFQSAQYYLFVVNKCLYGSSSINILKYSFESFCHSQKLTSHLFNPATNLLSAISILIYKTSNNIAYRRDWTGCYIFCFLLCIITNFTCCRVWIIETAILRFCLLSSLYNLKTN